MESFFSHFKSECFHIHPFQTARQVKDAVHQYMHFYNHERFQKN
ncbi:IS3 family transposase [Priestia megaterium]